MFYNLFYYYFFEKKIKKYDLDHIFVLSSASFNG